MISWHDTVMVGRKRDLTASRQTRISTWRCGVCRRLRIPATLQSGLLSCPCRVRYCDTAVTSGDGDAEGRNGCRIHRDKATLRHRGLAESGLQFRQESRPCDFTVGQYRGSEVTSGQRCIRVSSQAGDMVRQGRGSTLGQNCVVVDQRRGRAY
jgi:hypothetical protein